MRKPQVITYTARDGSTSYRVRFREPRWDKRIQGVRDWMTTETFYDPRGFEQADAFASNIAAHGVPIAVSMLRSGTGTTGRAAPLDNVFDAFMIQKERDQLKQATLNRYRGYYNRRIRTALGSMPIDQITDVNIQAFVNSLAGQLAPKTIQEHYILLRGVFAFACSASSGRLIEANPCQRDLIRDVPSGEQRVDNWYREEEWNRLIHEAFQVDRDGAELLQFLVDSGFRFGEATALSVMDVDTQHEPGAVHVHMRQVARRTKSNRVTIERVGQRVNGRRITGKRIKSERMVKLSPEAGKALLRRIARRGIAHDPTALVFTTRTGRQWRNSYLHQHVYQPSVARAGLQDRRVTVHGLRGTAAYLLWRQGADVVRIQHVLGHENLATTSRYLAMFDSFATVPDDVLDRLDAGRYMPEGA